METISLSEAQNALLRLQKEIAETIRSDYWRERAVIFLTALLPILAWPDPRCLRGDASGLMDLEELMLRANDHSDSFLDFAWEPMCDFLKYLPGMGMNKDRVIVCDSSIEMEKEHFSYMTMGLGWVGNKKFNETKPSLDDAKDSTKIEPLRPRVSP